MTDETRLDVIRPFDGLPDRGPSRRPHRRIPLPPRPEPAPAHVPEPIAITPADGCQFDRFFEAQRRLPPSRRSGGAMLVCRCPRCRGRYTL